MQESPDSLLLRKYVNRSCTPEELVKVLLYLERVEGRMELERLLEEEWAEFQPAPTDKSTVDDWFVRLNTKAGKKPAALAVQLKSPWLRYAAIVILLLGIGIFTLNKQRKEQDKPLQAFIDKYTHLGERSVILLPDSSLVYLGAGSHLKFPETFSDNTREVYLEGEAFFKITSDPHKSFIVHTAVAQTKVLGTSFKISAFRDRPLFIAVSTGKVGVTLGKHSDAGSVMTLLTPGQVVTWEGMGKELQRGSISLEELDEWQNGLLSFHNKTLAEIMQELGRVYNIVFLFKDEALADKKITTKIDTKSSLTNALSILTKIAHFSYVNKGKEIWITK